MPRTLVMGILNVTEDSFSDGGEWNSTERALAHAREMVDAGADIIDIGGESTRPGATRVDPDVERDRVVPVIAALHADGITTLKLLDKIICLALTPHYVK
jgi:dihydropteroate synthase